MDKYKERCSDCFCLVEGDNGEWICDDCEKEIHEIEVCPNSDEPEDSICVLCGKEIEGYGNDPWPLSMEGRCCDACNGNVILARLANLAASRK